MAKRLHPPVNAQMFAFVCELPIKKNQEGQLTDMYEGMTI